nr:glycosyltransferase [uncultured Cohaesibacter sp.]
MAHQNKIIIAGVGRSGTSFLFEEIASALKELGDSSFFYEPYLWSPEKVNKTGKVAAEPFDTRNFSPFGIHVHCESPLFLRKSHSLHDQMIARIFKGNGHRLTKLIRGNGRLEAYLSSDPSIKVIGVLRDVVGTINSAANHFSFFGEEFHPTDRPRFGREVLQRFNEQVVVPNESEVDRQVIWSCLWWQFMNRALFEAKRVFPDRILIVDYGSLKIDQEGAYNKIEEFLGIPIKKHRLNKKIGITSSANYLKGVNESLLEPFQKWLNDSLDGDSDIFVRPESQTLFPAEKILQSYSCTREGVVLRSPLFRTVIGWRYQLAREEEKARKLEHLSKYSIDTNFRVAAQDLKKQLSSPSLIASPAGVSVIIPVWNAADTLEETVASVWAQTGVAAEAVIVDDLSSDDTVQVAERLVQLGNGKLILNKRNVGPGMSRHKGIQIASNELISTVDADDQLMPLKLSAEIDAMKGNDDVVAYSDVIYRRNDGIDVWTFENFANSAQKDALPLIAGRRGHIPRDMTFSRKLYNRTCGFETMLRMYEDWSFKIELAGVASSWVHSSELGVQYEHKQSGLSQGEPSKHLYFLHGAFLRHIDMLVLRYGSHTIDLLQGALSQFGKREYITQGLSLIRKNAYFSGNLLSDFYKLKDNINNLAFRDDLSFEMRLSQAYRDLLNSKAEVQKIS